MKRSDINPLPANFARYINLVADVELDQVFDESVRQLNEIDQHLLESLDGKRYAPDKWTVKDILQHLADSDRIMAYQALMLARQDESVKPGFDEKLHVKNANAGARAVNELIDEIVSARAATKSLFAGFDDEVLRRKSVNWPNEISVLAMGFTIVGHQIHHLNIIKERYYPLLEQTGGSE